MVDPSETLYAIVGTFYIASAVALLVLNFGDRLNRAFSLYLVLEGGAMLVYPVPTGAGAAEWQIGVRGLFTYFTLGAPFALLYLAACYRERFGKSGWRRRALIILTAAALLTEAIHMFNHQAFYGAGTRPLRPFHYLVTILGPAAMAAILGHDGLQHPNPQRRRYLLGASLGFAFYPTAFALHLFVPEIMNVRPLEEVAAVAALAPVAYLLWRLGRVAWGDEDESRRHSARKYLAIFSLAPVSVVALALAWANLPLRDAPGFDANEAMRFIMTGWLVVFASIIAYSILRHELFGIEMGLKWTLRRSVVPGLIVAVFFTAEQSVQWILQDVGGATSWIYAAVICGGIAMGYRPLQRVADRFADAAMPQVTRSKDYTLFRKLQLYESALAAAWEDGKLEADEHRRLEELRARLEISVGDARAMEEDFIKASPAARRPVRRSHAL
ncbi:MAG TPA: hypothetical protein VI818_04360 [Candidatus Thermoplasmatota archaeon]|nr:hypothetical protein [Candidatus Thermoplasmatota archaeon]